VQNGEGHSYLIHALHKRCSHGLINAAAQTQATEDYKEREGERERERRQDRGDGGRIMAMAMT
jgi:hypothetical protein